MQNKVFIRMLAVLLTLIMCSSVFFIFASANENDYSYPSANLIETVYADTLLEKELGITLIEEERAFLHTESGFELIYNSNIPTSYVNVSFDFEAERLTVKALEYVYEAANGISVVWTPESASLNGNLKYFNSDDYTLEFDTHGAVDDKIDVKYKQSFTISKDTLNRLINLSYYSAPLLISEIEEKNIEYERLLNLHKEHVKKYELYIPMLEAYQKYLEEKRAYDAKYAEYSVYLAEMLEYERASKEYSDYLLAKEKYEADYAEYLKYLAYAESNQSKIEAYEKYQEKLEILRAQLKIITDTKTKVTDLNRTIYDAIMGSTVTSVIENKDLIANNITGASPDAIDRAGVATENLRTLMKDFFDITGEKARYNYYITNYESFRDNFADLFRCLDKLYMTPKVRGILIAQEKQEKYIILLAQLYYISNALSDVPLKNYDGTTVFDKNYIIGNGYIDAASPSSIIKTKDYLVDADCAAPLSDGYPVSPPKPDYVTMEEPTIPQIVKEPTAPETVEKPIAPAVVNQPELVLPPGDAPIKYIPPIEVVNLIAAYNKGSLSLREELENDYVLNCEITVTKAFRNFEEVTVIYYDKEYSSSDIDKKTELYRITVDKGSYADYMGSVPVKQEDAFYTYSHSGWTDESGREIDFLSIESSVNLYPKFDAAEKPYKTYWIVDGVTYREELKDPRRDIEDGFCYDFIGWDEKIDSQTLDITYTAIFEKKYLLELPDGGATVTLSENVYTVDTKSYTGALDVERLIKNLAGRGAVLIKTIKGEMSISYSELISMKENGVKTINLSVKKHTGTGYSYRIDAYNKEDEPIQNQIKIGVYLPCDVDNPEYLTVSYVEEGYDKTVRSTHNKEDNAISFIAIAGKTYNARLQYRLSVLQLDGISVNVADTVFSEGESVMLELVADGGIRVDRIYLIYPDGTKQSVAQTFTMPAHNVVLGVEYTVLEYTVTFVSDGKTIVSYKCHYGDTVEVPEDPKKASDANFEYIFVGWSQEIVPVTESVVYEAEYSRSALPKKDKGGLQIAPEILKALALALAAAVTLMLVIIPSSVMTFIVLRKRKKHFK